MITVIQDQTQLETLLASEPGLVLLDFYADWCQPCKALAQVFESLEDKGQLNAHVAKVNVDELRSIAVQFQVSGLPTTLLFKGGKPVDIRVGALDEAAVKQWIQSQLTETS